MRGFVQVSGKKAAVSQRKRRMGEMHCIDEAWCLRQLLGWAWALVRHGVPTPALGRAKRLTPRIVRRIQARLVCPVACPVGVRLARDPAVCSAHRCIRGIARYVDGDLVTRGQGLDDGDERTLRGLHLRHGHGSLAMAVAS